MESSISMHFLTIPETLITVIPKLPHALVIASNDRDPLKQVTT